MRVHLRVQRTAVFRKTSFVTPRSKTVFDGKLEIYPEQGKFSV